MPEDPVDPEGPEGPCAVNFSEPEISLTPEGLFTFTIEAHDLPPLSPEKQTLLILAVMPKILHDMRLQIEDDLDFHIKDPFGALEGDDFDKGPQH